MRTKKGKRSGGRGGGGGGVRSTGHLKLGTELCLCVLFLDLEKPEVVRRGPTAVWPLSSLGVRQTKLLAAVHKLLTERLELGHDA